MAEKPPERGKTTEGDDRNLVAAASSESGLDFETWVIDFWQKNRKTILTAIMVGLIIVVGLQLSRIVSVRRQAAISEDYAAAETDEARLEFAESHRGHPLAGAAFLTLADGAYAQGDYNEAAELYESAAGSLDIPALAFRAQLGQAVSLIQSGLNSKGEPLLEALAADEGATETIRAEALYHLASLALGAGDPEVAVGFLDQIEELAPVGVWANRASSLRNTIPVGGD